MTTGTIHTTTTNTVTKEKHNCLICKKASDYFDKWCYWCGKTYEQQKQWLEETFDNGYGKSGFQLYQRRAKGSLA